MPTKRSILREIYADALARCAPAPLVERHVRGSSFSWILAFGKCAVPMARGALDAGIPARGIVVAPEGYGDEATLPPGLRLLRGTHPDVTDASVAAARAALAAAAEEKGSCLVLASGGGSACLEAPLEPWFDLSLVIAINRALVRSGLDIESINTVRKHLSAVKGGRLGAQLDAGSRTLVYSDVPRENGALVGSGPTLADESTNEDAARLLDRLGTAEASNAARLLRGGTVPETPKELAIAFEVVAENGTLVRAAALAAEERGLRARRFEPEIAGDVADAARLLAKEAASLAPDELLVAGGEPTVRVHGPGRGGRCSELAVRFAVEDGGRHAALFGSSDGVDGSSPAAAVVVDRAPDVSRQELDAALGRSDSAALIGTVGEAIIMSPTGNNLRDLYLVAGR